MERDWPIVTPEIESYLHQVLPDPEPVLAEMEEEARRTGFPIVGPLVGRLLYTLAQIRGARRVFELGSGFGYSAYWFAKGVGPDGLVIHTDLSEDLSTRARKYLERAGLAERVQFAIGDALALFAAETGPFDLVFCDIDKAQYPLVPELALPRLAPGGLLVFDNLLWYGRVLDPEPESAATRGVLELTRRLYARSDLATTILPLRDGVSVSVKL